MKKGITKQIIQYMLSAILLISIISFFGCNKPGCNKPESDNKDNNKGNDTSITLTLNKSSINAIIGEKYSLSVTNKKYFSEVTWSSENSSVALIDENGFVEAYSDGETYLVAKSKGQEAKCFISVTAGNYKPELIIENERQVYNIAKDSSFPIAFSVLFNGKKYNDFTIESSFDSTNFDFVNNTIIPKNVSTDNKLYISCSWRGFSFENSPSLNKTISINVLDNVAFFINDRQSSLIELYTIEEVDGVAYQTNTDFIPTFIINSVEYDNVKVTVPDLVDYNQNKLTSVRYGQGIINLSCEVNGITYSSAINIDVIRPEIDVENTFDYFSAVSGKFKDKNNGYSDCSVVEKIFHTTEVENLKVYQDKTLLVYENGVIKGAKASKDKVLKSDFVFETDKVVFKAKVNVYALVLQDKADLKYLEINILSNDDPATPNIDETTTSYIDGYCEVLNNIDATGISIKHSAVGKTYKFNGQDVTVSYDRYSKGEIGKFGFTGCFNGNGYTISNLDLSVKSGETGGGLFGLVLGNSTIKNVGFSNVNISNASCLGYLAFAQANSGEYDGVKLGKLNISDVYFNLSKETLNPKGALFNSLSDVWMGNYVINNVVVDASELVLENSSKVSLLFDNFDSNYCKTVYGTTSRSNIIVITKDSVLTSKGTSKLFGENLANGVKLNNESSVIIYDSERHTRLVDEIFVSGVMTYGSVSELISSNPNLKTFASNSYWFTNDCLVFKSSKETILKVDNNLFFNDTFVLSTADSKKLQLITGNNDNVDIKSVEYDSSVFSVNANNEIALIDSVSTKQTHEIKLIFELNGIEKEQTVKVVAIPETFGISEVIEVSGLDNNFDYKAYLLKENSFENDEVIEAKQFVNNATYDLVVINNLIGGLQVKIKDDYSDVSTSVIEVTTSNTTYKFENVKVYSKLIDGAEDLSVFAQSAKDKKVSGYYKLIKSIDMAGTGIPHDVELLSHNNTGNVFQGVFDGQGKYINHFKPNIGGLFGTIYSDNNGNGGKSVIRNVAFINVQSQKNATSDNGAHDFSILAKYILNGNNGVADISNIYVEIDNTYLSVYQPVSNYKGLIYSNSLDSLNTFKMKNIIVEIENEEFEDTVRQGSGTILTRDHQIVNSTLETRSNRFDNVITVSKNSPCVYRQWVNNKMSEEFGIYMYFVYAENDIGKQGMRCDWLDDDQYPHNPISENKESGSYIYNNVYRYDTFSEIEQEKIDKLVQTGFWKIDEGKVTWADLPYSVYPSSETHNIDVGWLDVLEK